MADGGTYTMINVGEGTGGGMFTNPDPAVPPAWLAYVAVDDIAASTNKARELGPRWRGMSRKWAGSAGSA